MFDAPFTHSVWRSGERRTLSLSFGGSLLFHAGLAALVVYVLAAAPTGMGPPTETFLIALGAPGPGGGEVPLADPGARGAPPGADEATAESSEEAVEENVIEGELEERQLQEPDLSALDQTLAQAAPPDSLAAVGEGEGAAAGTASGQGADGGRGGGAGGGTTGGLGAGSGGQGGALRPLHLVVPRIPSGVPARQARGRSIILLVEVLPDGAVGEVRVERSTGNEALDGAAVAAARQMRYMPTAGQGTGGARWTRTEMRF